MNADDRNVPYWLDDDAMIGASVILLWVVCSFAQPVLAAEASVPAPVFYQDGKEYVPIEQTYFRPASNMRCPDGSYADHCFAKGRAAVLPAAEAKRWLRRQGEFPCMPRSFMEPGWRCE